MKKIFKRQSIYSYTQIVLFVFSFNINTYSQWTQQNSTIITHLQCVDFLNTNVGLAGGNDLVKTIDGGTTWDTISYTGPQALYNNGNVYYGVKVISNNIFIAAGWNVWDNASIIMRSVDSGITWTMPHQGNFGSGIQDLYFKNNTIGFAVGINGLLLKTVDGGISWSPQITSTTQTLFSITFSDNLHGYIAGDHIIITTNDGGINWLTTAFSDVGQCVSAKDSVAYMAGVNKLWKTTNFGGTWANISVPVNIYGPIYALNEDTVYTTDYERIFSSNSGMFFWSSFPSSAINKFNDIFMINKDTGFAVGDSGAIYKTINGGWPGTPIANFYADTNTICQYDSILFQNKTESGHTYQWLLNGNIVSNSYNPTIIFNTSGSNTVTLIVNEGSYIDTSQISVINVIKQPIATQFTTTLTGDTICPNTTTTIKVQNSTIGESYQLFIDSIPIGSSQNGNGGILTFNTGLLTSTSVLKIKSMVSNACDTNYYSVVDTIFIVPNANTSTLFYATNPIICLNDSTDIVVQNSQSGFTYELVNNGINTGKTLIGTGTNISFNTNQINSDNKYTILATNSYGCSVLLDSNTTVNIDSVIANFTIDNNNIFIGDTLTFTNNSFGSNYSWDFGPGSIPSTSSIQNPNTSYNTSGLFKEIELSVSSNFGCTDTILKTVNVYDIPNSGIGQLCWADTLPYTNLNFTYGYKILDQEVDYLGNSYITGYYYETNYPTSYNMFLIKYDNSGNTLWIKKSVQSNYITSDKYKSSFGTCIATDLEGNVYVGGSNGGKKLIIDNVIIENNGYGNTLHGFIVKYNSSGNALWNIKSEFNNYTSISQDAIGISDILFKNNNEIYFSVRGSRGNQHYFILGNTYQMSSINGKQVYIYKINKNGQFISQLAAGPALSYNTSMDYLYNPNISNGNTSKLASVTPKLAITKCNDILLIGCYGAYQLNFGNISLTGNASLNGYVAISNGDLSSWKSAFNTYGINTNADFFDMKAITPIFTIDDNNNFYQSMQWGMYPNGYTGQSYLSSTILVGSESISNRDGSLILKYDLNGNMQWYNKSSVNFIRSMYAASSNNILFYGEYLNTLGIKATSNSAVGIVSEGQRDIFMGSINSNGDLNWLRSLGNSKDDEAFKMAGNKCGDIYISGSISDTVTFDGINLYGDNNLFVAKYSSNNVCSQSCNTLSLNTSPCLMNDNSVCSNQTFNIKWGVNGITNTIDLNYSLDSGITNNIIIQSYGIINSNYNWIIPDSLFIGQWILINATALPGNQTDSKWIYLYNKCIIPTQDISICIGDSAYIYGTYRNVAGIYYDSLTTINGCDSILSTNLIVNPTYFNNHSITICQSDSVLINGIFQNTSGIYYDSLQSVNGCDSILKVLLTVKSPPNPNLVVVSDTSTMCSGESVVLDVSLTSICGISATNTCSGSSTTLTSGTMIGINLYNTMPTPYSNIYKNVKQQFLYKASELNSLGFFGGKITKIGWEITQLFGTTIYHNFQIKMGCTSIDNLTTTDWITNLTQVYGSQFIIHDYIISTGWNFHDLDEAYEWDGISNIVIEICYDNPSKSYNAVTSYHSLPFQACAYYLNDTIPACSSPMPSFTLSKRPITKFTYCSIPQNSNLYNYSWSPTNNLSDASIENPIASPTISTNYDVNINITITDSFCPGSSTIAGTSMVLVNPLPNVDIAQFLLDTVCGNGGLITLPIGTPSGGSYSGIGVSSGSFDPSTAGIGTYNVIYTFTDTNSCINSDTTMITVELCTGINGASNDDFGILIYPNPNTGLFTIEKPKGLNKEIQVKLLDATSKLIIDKLIPIGKQKIGVDISSYSKGIYYLQLIIDNEIFVKQILKN